MEILRAIITIYGISLLGGAGVALVIFRALQQDSPLSIGNRLVQIQAAKAAIYCLVVLISMASPSEAAHWWHIVPRLMLLVVTTPLLFVFILHYIQAPVWLIRATAPLWAIIPLISCVLLVVPSLSDLFVRDYRMAAYYGVMLRESWAPGPWFLVHAVNAYLLAVLAVVALIYQYWRVLPAQRVQVLIFIAAVCLPGAISLFDTLRIGGLPILWHPFGLVGSMALLYLAIRRYGRHDLFPPARTTLLEALDDLIVAVNEQAIISDLNPAMARFLGVEVRSCRGRRLSDFAPFNNPMLLARLMSRRERAYHEVAVPINGQMRLHEATVSYLTATIARPANWLIMLHDVHEWRTVMQQLEVREQRYSALFTQMSDAAIMLDLDLVCTEANTRALDLLGYSLTDLIGLPMRHLVADEVDDQARFADLLRAARDERTPATLEVRLITRQGGTIPAELSIAPIANERGEPILIQIIAHSLVERLRLHASEQARQSISQTFRGFAEALSQTIDRDRVCRLTLEYLDRVFPYDVAAILLIEDDEAGLVVMTHVQAKAEVQPFLPPIGVPFAIDPFPTLAQILATGLPIQALAPAAIWRGLAGEHPMQTQIAAPLRSYDAVFGVLIAGSDRTERSGTGLLDEIQIIADQTGSALQKAQLSLQARQGAMLQERQRLARDLHDAVSQTLFSASLIIDMAMRRRDQQPELLVDNAPRLQRLIRGALGEMRALLHELRPSTLVQAQLTVLLNYLADGAAGRTDALIDLHLGPEPPLDADERIVFYRIAQEALNNTIKHAQATWVTMSLGQVRGGVELTIVDNGIGFEPAAVASHHHFGLAIMHERAAEIGARFTITSDRGVGTTVRLWLPPEREHAVLLAQEEELPHGDHQIITGR